MDGPALIRAAREQAGLTQAELADQLHVMRTNVTRWESGRTRPTLEQMNALAMALPVTVAQLIRAFGAQIAVPAEARIPRALLDDLAKLDAESLQVVARVARALRGPQAR